ncbi:hypothetical protein AGMMS49942_25870 [Spirochaetia bacterium]|nr:hypothetical protein AGMMS49942_25870 [Spirochaetia bacterium]
MDNKDQIEKIIKEHSFTDYKWIIPRENIIVAQWVRFRCQFGCKNYGKNGSCPPAVPSVEECRKMIYEYENAIIFHFSIQYGSCIFCKDCIAEGTRIKCIHKDKSRPGADAMGIDVYQTAHNVGYPIQVVKDH